MEKKTGIIIKLAAALAVCAAFWALDRYVISHPVLRVFSMAALVLFCAWLIALILGAVKPSSHRARTVMTLLASLTRYLAVIVILCWGLSIFGVDVNTIVASVGIIALMAGLLLSDRRHQRGIHLAGAFMLVGYMVGTLLILCSPGTLIRAAASGTDLHYMLTHLPFGLLNIFMNLRLFWLLVIVMAVMHWRRHVAITGFLHDNRFLLLAIAAEALFLLPLGRVVEPRALFGMEMFSMILLLRLLPVTNIHLGRVAAVGYILLYLPVLNIVWQNHRDSQAFHEEMSRSDEAVFFDVPYYHGMSRHYVGSRIDLDHHRTAFNKEYAAYYGKQGILVLPSRYRQELYLTRSFLTPQHQCAPGVYTDDDITFDIIPLPDDQPLPPSTLDHEYVSFPSGKYLLRDNMPFVNDGNAQIRPQAKKRRRR